MIRSKFISGGKMIALGEQILMSIVAGLMGIFGLIQIVSFIMQFGHGKPKKLSQVKNGEIYKVLFAKDNRYFVLENEKETISEYYVLGDAHLSFDNLKAGGWYRFEIKWDNNYNFLRITTLPI